MAKKRIVITGMGVVSCFGNDVSKFYDALLAGKSGVVPITRFDVSKLKTKFAGEIPDFDSTIDDTDYLDHKQRRRLDSFIKYGIVAGKKAMEDAGFDLKKLPDNLDKTRCGILIGSGMGGMETFCEGVRTLEGKGPDKVSPFFVPYIITNMAGALLAIDLGFMGPNYSISTACATSNFAITAAANHIRSGDVDLMVCGGAEAALTPMGVSSFNQCKALSVRNDAPEIASRPWDKDRDGFVIGEGAGVLVIESLEHAQKRGARIYAEYLGGSFTCDAFHMTSPREDGLGVSLCVEGALRDASVNKERVNYINAHATSTIQGDIAEVEAMKRVFGERAKRIPINGTKSMTGHCLGAAGGIEAVATVMAIWTRKIHPTINLDNQDPECDLDFVPKVAREATVDIALSNSFGFGGHNSSVVFGKFTR